MITDLLDCKSVFFEACSELHVQSYADEVVLQITLFLKVMEVKQLNKWNKLLFIIPHRIVLRSLKIWLLYLSLNVV